MTRPANSSVDSRLSGIISRKAQVRSSRRRRDGTIYMSRTPVHGVCRYIPIITPAAPYTDGSITAHRTLIVRKLKGLEEFIPFTSVHWHMLEQGTLLP